MARINTYTIDNVIHKNDTLLGSDGGAVTRNYSIANISDYFKNNNAAGVAGQFVWEYKNTEPQSGHLKATFSSGSTFANLTSIKANKFTSGETINSIENILTILEGKDILLIDTEDPDNYGVYTVTNISQDGSTNNYDLTLTYKNTGNGSLQVDKYYAAVVFGGGADKTQELTFTSSSFARSGGSLLTETISGSSMPYVIFDHNLGKKPSISVEQEGSPGQVAMMPVKYINNNTVRVYFTGTTSGKIYAN
tara:strand:+ start:211 stop:960 length:750 start_codon:yes stop_codon:yes gene_type:complete